MSRRGRGKGHGTCGSTDAKGQVLKSLKDALGLDHFEGRTYRGWHHHVTPRARVPHPGVNPAPSSQGGSLTTP
jgi:hypothetical protein